MMNMLNQKARQLKQGAIRAMFDRAAGMEGVISLGIGEPDMPTPALICQAGMEELERGLVLSPSAVSSKDWTNTGPVLSWVLIVMCPTVTE